MMTFEAAADEYLHRIARVQPWTKRSVDQRLGALGRWLFEQLGAPPGLDDVAPDVVARHAEQAGLAPPQHRELFDALDGLYRWARREGLVTNNPFAQAPP